MNQSECIEVRGMLPLFVGGDLESGDTERVGLHLGDCEACQAHLSRARVARQELRAELSRLVDGHEPQLWPVLRESLAREGLFRQEHAAPTRRAAGLFSMRTWRPVAGVAAALLAVAYFGQSDPDPAPTRGNQPVAETILDKGSLIQESGPGTLGTLQPGALAETDTAPAEASGMGGLRPLGLGERPLFDKAREEILKDAMRQMPMYQVMPAGQSIPEQGELASRLSLQ